MSVKTSPQAAQTSQSSGTLSQIQRSSAHSELQTISADYYNITDANGSPLAGLLVLMDRKHRPVRAELQLNESTTGPQQELAQRQAHLLISERYHGDRPLPLSVVRTQLEYERISIPLDSPVPSTSVPAWIKPLIFVLVALLVFGAGGWFLNDLLTANETSVASAPPDAETSDAGAEALEADPESAAAEEAPADAVEGRIFQQNDLPVSRNAIPMEVGQRVRIRPNLQVALRTEPGATAGEVIGTMKDSMEATIINGPVWLAGNSDTIVWWHVQLDDGTEAWVAANTSELTLLEPVD